MFYLTRRQTRAAMSAAAGAAVYLAASELGKGRLKMTGLFVLASASMAGMVTAKASAKAYSTEKRLSHFLGNGGSVGGNLYVNGDHHTTGNSYTSDHHVGGSLYGASGTLSIGDGAHVVSNSFTSDGRITGHDDMSIDNQPIFMVGNPLTIFRGTPAANSTAIVNFLQATGLSQ